MLLQLPKEVEVYLKEYLRFRNYSEDEIKVNLRAVCEVCGTVKEAVTFTKLLFDCGVL